MNETWWVGEDDLDKYQRAVITLPMDGNHLVFGPPGSGKTNLLLLRANYLYLAGHQNIVIVAFTRTLRDFIASGGLNYSFPVSKIQTCRMWGQDLLRQYGKSCHPPEDFEEQRQYFIQELGALIEEKGLCGIYDCILLDEAQDYVPAEIRTFEKLGTRLFCVADSRQKIYEGEDPFGTLEAVLGQAHRLRYHYRNGLRICRLADGIARGTASYEALADTSNYDEEANPSNVEHIRCADLDEQAKRILSRLDAQLKAYPNEVIGVICPKREDLLHIWGHIRASPFDDRAVLHLGPDRQGFEDGKPIFVGTFHAAKGLEFRSLHMAGCDLLKRFGHNRNMAFTAVTRTKTSLAVYYSDDIHGYLEAALSSLEPPPDLPDLQDVFGAEK